MQNYLQDCFMSPVNCQVVWLFVVWLYVKQLHPVLIYQSMQTYCNSSNENILSSDFDIKFSLGMRTQHLSIIERENIIMLVQISRKIIFQIVPCIYNTPVKLLSRPS